MAFDYDRVAPNYDVHRRGRGPYYPALLRLLREANPRLVLEVGAGTGNNTAAIASDFPGDIIALELSAGMIAQGRAKTPQGREKNPHVRWIQGNGLALPFSSGSIDFAYATYVLHHIADLETFFRELRRTLRGGIAAFVTVPRHFILAHPMNAYFPSFAQVDAARFQHEDEVATALRHAGFSRVERELHRDAPRRVDQSYVEKIAGQFISTYALLPEAEFHQGLTRLRHDLARNGTLDVTIVREAITVWGYY